MKREKATRLFLRPLLFLFFIFLTVNVFSNPRIISVTMNPPAPSFGEMTRVTVTYCGQLYNRHMIAIAISSLPARDNADLSGNGQIFLVSRAGLNVATSQPAINPGGEIGYEANPSPGGGTPNCSTCSGTNNGLTFVKTYDIRVPPAEYFPGCDVTNLYLHVGMKDQNIGASEWTGFSACQSNSANSWPIGTTTRGFNISKRAEGVLQAQNDLVLFSVDYEYWNGPLRITDIVPGGGQLELVSYGPQSLPLGGTVSAPLLGANTGSFAWNFRDRTGVPGRSAGTVWMLYRIITPSPVPGVPVSNSATGIQSGSTNQNATASVVIGQAAVSIIKSQSASNPAFGSTLTYYLSYQVNGSKLIAYQSFDDIPLGVYGSLGGLGGPAVPGWRFSPSNGVEGQWTVEDVCDTGDRAIRGDTILGPGPGTYGYFPQLLFDGLPSTNNMCKGIIMTDVYIEPGGYEGADSMIVIRSDEGGANANAYGLVLSVDDFIGDNTTGNIGFQKCTGSSCVWPLSVNTVAVTANKWWRVKIEVAPPPANNQYQFRAKVWAKGDPEPAGWVIQWTDTAAPAAFNCNNGQRWRPGIAEQHYRDGDVENSYNNFIVYEPRVSANTMVWDTVPTGINYVDEEGPYPGSYNGGNRVVSWNLGSISDEGGTFTWWGTVAGCDPITNDGWINGAPPMVANRSNQVIALPICPTPVITLVKSHQPAGPVSIGAAVTWALNVCNSAAGPTANPMTVWDTIPTSMLWGGWVGPAGNGTTAPGGVIWWDASPLNAGTCRQFTWWGTVNP